MISIKLRSKIYIFSKIRWTPYKTLRNNIHEHEKHNYTYEILQKIIEFLPKQYQKYPEIIQMLELKTEVSKYVYDTSWF